MMRYCKAYKNSDLREFYGSHAQPVPGMLEDERISFLWDDFVVRTSPIKQEKVLFDQVTEEWKHFCQNQLAFSVPEQPSSQKLPVAHSHPSAAGNTFVPFTSGQQWLIEELACTGEFFFNIPLLQLSMPKIGIQELEQILRYLFCYHDALRIKLTHKNKRWQQWIVAHEDALPATWICLSRLSATEQMTFIEGISHEMQHQLNTLQGFLWHFSFCEIDETHGHALWVMNHLITDGMSNQILLQDFRFLHNQMMQGTMLKLPKQKTTFREWAERIDSYVHSPEARKEINEYWLKLPWELVKPLPLDFPEGVTLDPLTSRPGYGTFASSRSHYFALSPEQTQLLLATLESTHVQLPNVLTTAMALVIASWSHSNVVTMFMLDNARLTMFKDISLLHTLGFIAHGRRLLFDLRTATSRKEALEAVTFQLKQAPNHGRSLDWFLRREPVPEELQHIPWLDVCCNFLGKSSMSLKQSDSSPFPLKYPDHYRNHVLVCEFCVVRDRLEIKWEYSADIYREATIEKFARHFIDILCSFRAEYALKDLF